MKKKLVLLFNLITLFLAAQSVDIDNYHIYIQHVDFPVNYVENKTYKVNVTGKPEFSTSDKVQQIKINGWKSVNENATLDISAAIYSFSYGTGTILKRVEDVKDKEGKVVSQNVYYRYQVTNTGSGKLIINGEKNELPRKLSKKDIEKAEKEKAKKIAEVNSNPFLQNTTASPISSDTVKKNSTKTLAYELSLNKGYVYNTSESTSSGDVWKEFNANYQAFQIGHENAYREDYIKIVNDQLNSYYGYNSTTSYVKFKRLDSEKHPEFTMFDNATKALKVIFGKMVHNQNIDVIETELIPIIQYFEGLTKKYTADEKHPKRLRGAAYYNLARIYQYLDRHDKAIEVGKAIIATKYDEDDGEDFINESEEYKRQLGFYHLKTRHYIE